MRYFRFNSTTTSAVNNTVDYNYIPDNNPSAGNGAFISLDSDGGVPASYLNNGCIVTLPIEWGEFTVESNKNDLLVKWQTLTERNNDYFDIELSEGNTDNFTRIGTLNGAGSSSKTHSYHFFKDEILEGYYYLRIKQVDFDGKYTYSPVKPIAVTGSNFAIKQIKNSGISSTFVMNQNVKHGSIIRICDITGKIIYEGTYSDSSNEIHIDQVLKGLLLLSIEEPFKEISTFKIIVD